MTEPQHFRTISEFHMAAKLPLPDHPHISVINMEETTQWPGDLPASRTLGFYSISLKRNHGSFKYGQHQYETQGGVLYFIAPGQVFSPPVKHAKDTKTKMSGYGLYIHPDFLWNTALAKKIKSYEYFDYAVSEALWLTEKEESIVIGLMKAIQGEYVANQDRFSQDIMISLVETLLNYADRFYHRQFLTHKKENHELLERLELILNDHFSTDQPGQPSVQYIAQKLNLSPNYLGSLLKIWTGRNTQQHIQDKIIEIAKQKISTTSLTVSEIAYALGFDHPQSFGRLFKAKTGLSPLAFRQSFN